MHNPQMDQTIIKGRIIPGSSQERAVYIAVGCRHFDFACSSAASNTEPLGMAETFLKAPFFPLFSLWCASTNSSASTLHQAIVLQCSAPSKRKWETKVQSLIPMPLSCSSAWGSCQIPPMSQGTVLTHHPSHPNLHPSPGALQPPPHLTPSVKQGETQNSHGAHVQKGKSSMLPWFFTGSIVIFWL